MLGTIPVQLRIYEEVPLLIYIDDVPMHYMYSQNMLFSHSPFHADGFYLVYVVPSLIQFTLSDDEKTVQTLSLWLILVCIHLM